MLQKVLETEPDRLTALITVQQDRVIDAIAAYFLPLLERDRTAGLVARDVDLAPVGRVRGPALAVAHRLARTP